MTTNYNELRQAAETATPGPWRALERRWENDTDWLVIFSFRTDDEGLEIWDEDSSLPSQANAQFIALANPTTTLALLDEIAALRAELKATIDFVQSARPGEFHFGAAKALIGDAS